MTIACLYTLPLAECSDVSLVGGKAANLGRLIAAGFPAPGGFVVTTQAYAQAQRGGSLPGLAPEIPADVAEEVREAYRAMGGGTVAVRSSATAEDLADTSMAGQYETYLNIGGESALLEAVRKCWGSLHSPRIVAYFKEHGIDPHGVAMGVVVQRQIAADVAGVLFTVNPNQRRAAAGRREMLIEASWGLGESVVSGRVQPDVLRLHAETGKLLDMAVADKQVQLLPGESHETPVEETRRREACLRDGQIERLWSLGCRAAEYFGVPQDIEWAMEAGELYLVQSRPITTLRELAQDEALLLQARKHLQNELHAGHGPWVLHNISETLPHPTPLTWSVIQPFMAGGGGYGQMYCLAGFEPSPKVEKAGFLERIAGRVYMDVARVPEMFFVDFPYGYDVELLKRNPDAGQGPPTVPTGSLRQRLAAGRKLAAATARLRGLADDFDLQLRNTLFPSITSYVAAARQMPLAQADRERLISLWLEHEDQVLDAMGSQLLMPGLISGIVLDDLRAFLADHVWQEDPASLAQLIASGGDGPPNRTLLADAELYAVGQKQRSLESWLASHGHRAAGEFDLAAPRWREQPDAAADMARRLAAGGENPLDRLRRHRALVEQRVAELRAGLGHFDRPELDRLINVARRYVAFREDAKDFLMLGYDLLRDVALEAGRRLGIGQDVFQLTRDELFVALRGGALPAALIQERNATYAAEARLELPRVIDASAVALLGEAPEAPTPADAYRGLAISLGRAAGAARIVTSPSEAGVLEKGYILVCPSTDPSWTPLFVNAGGLVLERGGALSHGAVVAREMGLPAVVLPNATRLLQDGQIIQIDGNSGWVSRGAANPSAAAISTPSASSDPADVHVPFDAIPPAAGKKDRIAGRIALLAAAGWTIYLLAFFLLPPRWVFLPTLAVMDGILWPIIRLVGRPAGVALIAAAIALFTLMVQKFATDNRRILAAKRRAAALQKEAAKIPADSPRRAALLRLAAPVQVRALMAAMVPVGLLLGPLVMPFVWFSHRVDPAVWNAPPGSAVQIVASVDAGFAGSFALAPPPGVEIDQATPATRTLPPIRKTLEHLLALYRQNPSDPGAAPELKFGPAMDRAQAAADLEHYLSVGIPPQGITWTLRPTENFAGRFEVALHAGNMAAINMPVTLGDDVPPAESVLSGTSDSPIRTVRVVHLGPKVQKAFWQPLPGLSVGWVWVYILAYVPALLLARPAMKVA